MEDDGIGRCNINPLAAESGIGFLASRCPSSKILFHRNFTFVVLD